MRGIKTFSIILLISLLFTTYCIASTRKMSDLQIKDVAGKILDNMLEGFKRDDYFKYSQDLDQSLKQLGATTSFYQTNRYLMSTLGTYQKRKRRYSRRS